MLQRRCSGILKAIVIINFLIFTYFYFVLSPNHVENDTSIQIQDHVEPNPSNNFKGGKKPAVTVVFLDYEFHNHNLEASVSSIKEVTPDANILILAENEPYPPFSSKLKDIKVIKTNIHPNVSQHERNPLRHISTEFTAFVPDGVIVKSPNTWRVLTHYSEISKRVDVLLLPIGPGAKTFACNDLTVDLRQWTLQFDSSARKGSKQSYCQSIQSKAVIFIKTRLLHDLAEPFIRPFNEGFYIQAALRGLKIKRLEGSHLVDLKEIIFKDEHSRSKYQRSVVARQLQLYKKFGIKRVIQNGKEEYFGCTKHSSRCFGTILNDMPSFIQEGKWTPPCCLKNLRETAQHVFEIFEEYNVKYWLEGGSLLGATRLGDIIPWDYDVDIGMYLRDLSNIEPLRLANQRGSYEDPEHFVWMKATEGKFFRVQFSQSNHLHVDIYPFYEKDNVMTKDTWFQSHPQDTEFPSHYLKPLEHLDFVGRKALVPNNHVQFLELKFGQGVIENPKYPNSASVNN